MSEELVLLKEYCDSLGLSGRPLEQEDVNYLRRELKDAGEMGLSAWVGSLGGAKELEEYLKDLESENREN